MFFFLEILFGYTSTFFHAKNSRKPKCSIYKLRKIHSYEYENTLPMYSKQVKLYKLKNTAELYDRAIRMQKLQDIYAS